ncbi:MAG: porin, partial [Symploca sp. SIO3C6]|nr:porin [Symploca sp. SIO3C6]
FSVGAGLTWQASDRVSLYGNVNVPLGPGGNAVDPNDFDIGQQLIWQVGGQYDVSPKVGLDLYATNGFGVTPATGILAFVPDGSDPLYGLRLNYTPDLGRGYRSTFRDNPTEPLTHRDRQLLLDGFTLSTANTIQPGRVRVDIGGGTNERFNIDLAYSPDEDLQLEAIVEEFSSDNDAISDRRAGDNIKFLIGAQVRFLNQQQGDPLSLGVKVLGGRDTDSNNRIGTLFAEIPMTYQVGEHTAVFLNPRIAAFTNTKLIGTGVGLNHEIVEGLQLIGEVTPVWSDNETVWAVGTRYNLPKHPVSLDLYVSNAAGRNGLGNLVSEDSTNVGLNINWMIGDR